MKYIIILTIVLCIFAVFSGSEENQNIVSGNDIKGAESLSWPGIYRPTTDLNNFQYSTLGKDIDGKVSGSTIGYGEKRVEDNVELNEMIQTEIKTEEGNINEITNGNSVDLSTDSDGSVISSNTEDELSESDNNISNVKVIQWTDENGVVHVTNDPTQVYIKSNEKTE